jgi:hypothetical protein
MKVTLKTFGGHFTPPPQTVDTAAWPAAQRAELQRLLGATRRVQAPENAAPDGFSYLVETDDDADPIRSSDAAMGPEFAALLDLLRSGESYPQK